MSKIKTAKGSYIEDITGQTFNRLTVLELTDKKDNNIRLVRIPYTDFNEIDTDYILSRIGDKIEQ